MSGPEDFLRSQGLWDSFISSYRANLPASEEILEEFLNHNGNAETTKGGYRSDLTLIQLRLGMIGVQVVRERDLGDMTYADFDEIVNQLRRDPSMGKGRKKRIIATTKSFLGFLERKYGAPIGSSGVGSARFKELKIVESNKEVILTPRECREMLERARLENLTHYCVLFLFIDTGMRIGELTNIKIQDVNLEQRYLKTVGKTGAKKFIYSSECAEVLRRYLTFRQQMVGDNDYLFVSTLLMNGLSICTDHMRRGLKQYFPRNKWVTPHTFRRTFISNRKFLKGQDTTIISFLIGHKMGGITESYMHMSHEQALKFYDDGYWLNDGGDVNG